MTIGQTRIMIYAATTIVIFRVHPIFEVINCDLNISPYVHKTMGYEAHGQCASGTIPEAII